MKSVNLESMIAELEEWAAQHDLVEKALAGAKVFLHNNEQDEVNIGLKPAFDYSETVLAFDRQSLVFKSAEGGLSHAYIDTRIGLYVRDDVYLRELKPVGYYRLITSLDGQVEDDYLVFAEPYKAEAGDKP